MRKAIILGAILFSLSASAQKESKIIDSTIEIKMSLNDYKAVMSAIDQNIDSKKISKEILEFLAKNAKMVGAKKIPIK